MRYPFLDADVKNYEEILKGIREELLESDNERIEDIILVLTVLCGVTSREEFVELGITYPYAELVLSKLYKEEFISKLSPSSAGSKRNSAIFVLYTFTKRGYERAKHTSYGNKVFNEYRKKKENPVLMHDYMNGYNLIGCIKGLSNLHINWIRERSYGGYRRDNKTLACDSEVMLRDHFTIHFEEDLGSEDADKVLDKLLRYREYHSVSSGEYPILSAASTKDAIVYSIYKIEHLESEAYSPTKVRAFISYLRENAVPQDRFAYDYLKEAGETLPETVKSTLVALLEESADEPIRQKDAEAEKNYRQLRISDILDMDYKWACMNPFYRNSFRRKQYHNFLEKRAKLINTFTHYKDTAYREIHRELMRGCPVYLVPTLLLPRYIRFIAEFSTYVDKIAQCLFAYFGKMDKNSYSPIREIMEDEVYLRNGFDTESGTVCFEFPLIDLSAAGRINAFFQNESKITHPTHLVIIIDSVSEAFKYSKEIRDFDRHRSLSRTERGICLYSAMDRLTSDLFYLKRMDLEEGNVEKLFFVSGYMEGHDKEGNVVVFKENELFSLLPEKVN